jgi:hypothetical protein
MRFLSILFTSPNLQNASFMEAFCFLYRCLMQLDFDILRARSDAAAAIVIHQCKRISLILRGFNPNQARDEIGRWINEGGLGRVDRQPLTGT